MKQLITILFLFLLSRQTFAGDVRSIDDRRTAALGNIVDDYLVCSIYYTIGAGGRVNAGEGWDSSGLAAADEARKMAIVMGVGLMKLSSEVMLAKNKLILKSMTDEYGNDYKKFSILLVKYADNCKSLMEDATPFIVKRLNEQGLAEGGKKLL